MSKFVVAVRVRPLTKEEQQSSEVLSVQLENNKCIVVHNLKLGGKKRATWEVDSRCRVKRFNFDHVFWSVDSTHANFSSQAHVYRSLCDKVLSPVLKGFNSCMFAYGQTGSGKTHTMMGDENDAGFIPRLCEDLFERLEVKKTETKEGDHLLTYKVFVSFIEVYNEKVYDLLNKTYKKNRLNEKQNAKEAEVFCSNQSLESSIQSCREFKSCYSLKNCLETPTNEKKIQNKKSNFHNKSHNFMNYPRSNLASSSTLNRSKTIRHHQQPLRVREHPSKGPFVEGLMEHEVGRVAEVKALLKRGNSLRTTAETHMHKRSSRSHAIFTVTFIQARLDANKPMERRSKINLVDLAGSERSDTSRWYNKERAIEGAGINKSLATLATVIQALAHRSLQVSWNIPNFSPRTAAKQAHIPYRDSTLTWLLKDSLQGNAESAMIATISPSSTCYFETINTLYYGQKANEIINKPHINEDPVTRLIRGLREEISRLKSLLMKQKMKDTTVPFSDVAVGTEDIFKADDEDDDDGFSGDDNDINDDNDSGYPKTKNSIENFGIQISEDVFVGEFYGLRDLKSINEGVFEKDNIGNANAILHKNYDNNADEEKIIMRKLLKDEVEVDQLTRTFIEKWKMMENHLEKREAKERSAKIDRTCGSGGKTKDTKEEGMSRGSCDAQPLNGSLRTALLQVLESLSQRGLKTSDEPRKLNGDLEHGPKACEVLDANELLKIFKNNGVLLQRSSNELEVKQNGTSHGRLFDEKRPSPIGSEDAFSNQLPQKPLDQFNNLNSINLKACLYILSDLKNLSPNHLNVQEINKVIQMYALTLDQTDKCVGDQTNPGVEAEEDGQAHNTLETNNLINNTSLTTFQLENPTLSTTQSHNTSPSTTQPHNTPPTKPLTNDDEESVCSEDSLDLIDSSQSFTKQRGLRQAVEVDKQGARSILGAFDAMPSQFYDHNVCESVGNESEKNLENENKESNKFSREKFEEIQLGDEDAIENTMEAFDKNLNEPGVNLCNQSEKNSINDTNVDVGNSIAQDNVTIKNASVLEGINDEEDEMEDFKVTSTPANTPLKSKEDLNRENNRYTRIEMEYENIRANNDKISNGLSHEKVRNGNNSSIEKFENINTTNTTILYGENVEGKSSKIIAEKNKEIECRSNDKIGVVYDSSIGPHEFATFSTKQEANETPNYTNFNKKSPTENRAPNSFSPSKQIIYTPLKHLDMGVNCDLEYKINDMKKNQGDYDEVYDGGLERLTKTDVISFNMDGSKNDYTKSKNSRENFNSFNLKLLSEDVSKEKKVLSNESSDNDGVEKSIDKDLLKQNTLVSASYLMLSNPRVDSGDEGDIEYEYIGLQPVKNNDRKIRERNYQKQKKHFNNKSCKSKFSIGFNVSSDTDQSQFESNDQMKVNTSSLHKSSSSLDANLSCYHRDNDGSYFNREAIRNEECLKKFHRESALSVPSTPNRTPRFSDLSKSHNTLPRTENNYEIENDHSESISENESALDLSNKSVDKTKKNMGQNKNRFDRASENLNRTIDFSRLPSYKHNSSHLPHQINIASLQKDLSKSGENLLDNDFKAFEDLLPFYHPLPSSKSPPSNIHFDRPRLSENLFENSKVSTHNPHFNHSSMNELHVQKPHLPSHMHHQSRKVIQNSLNKNQTHGETRERRNENNYEKLSTCRVLSRNNFDNSKNTKNSTANNSTSSINSITLVLEEQKMSSDDEKMNRILKLNSKLKEISNKYTNSFSDEEEKVIRNKKSYDKKTFEKINVQSVGRAGDYTFPQTKYISLPDSTSNYLKISKKEKETNAMKRDLASKKSYKESDNLQEESLREFKRGTSDGNDENRLRVREKNSIEIKNKNSFTKSCQTSLDKLGNKKHEKRNCIKRIKELEKEKIEITRMMGEGLSVWKTRLELMEARLNYNMGQTDLLLSMLQNEGKNILCEPIDYDLDHQDGLALMCLDEEVDRYNNDQPFKRELFNKKYCSNNVPIVDEKFVNTRIEKIKKLRSHMSNELDKCAEEL